MATRGRATFQKRQKEMARKEKRQKKEERRELRKRMRAEPERFPPQDEAYLSDNDGDIENESESRDRHEFGRHLRTDE